MPAATPTTGCPVCRLRQYSPIARVRNRLRAASRSAILKRLTLLDGLIWATILARTQFVNVLTLTPRYRAAPAALR